MNNNYRVGNTSGTTRFSPRSLLLAAPVIAIAGSALAVPGDSLTPPFRVNTFTPGVQNSPSIASDSSGDFVAAWTSYGQDGASASVRAQRYSRAGAPLGGEVRVDQFTGEQQALYPKIATNASGASVIAWDSIDRPEDDGSGIWAQRFDRNGVAQGTQFHVNSISHTDQFDSNVAMDDTGRFVVTWDDEAEKVHAQAYDASGRTVGAQIVIDDAVSASAALYGNGAFVLTWSSFDPSSGDQDILAQGFAPDGGAVTGAFLVNTTTARQQRSPSIGMDGAGNFVIAWVSDQIPLGPPFPPGFFDAGVFAQRFAASGFVIGSEFQVSQHGLPDNTKIDVNAAGEFVITWSGDTRDPATGDVDFTNRVHARRYDATGEPLGDDFPVAFNATGEEEQPAVAIDDAGAFVEIWSGINEADADDRAVFAQRFEGIRPPAADGGGGASSGGGSSGGGGGGGSFDGSALAVLLGLGFLGRWRARMKARSR